MAAVAEGLFTDRQLEILALCAQGQRPAKIAQTIFWPERTVRYELEKIRERVGHTTVTAAVAKAIFDGQLAQDGDGNIAPCK